MLTNDVFIKDATLTNSLNMTGFATANNALEINREVLLSNYTPEILSTTWSVLCQFIAKNYHQGKGTYVKGFGTFTFDNYKVDLEGTTNQFIRDKKLRSPVFIVSTEFNETLKPGQYTKNGVIYYNQKQNNSVNHVKLNFSEISYAISMSKEETANIIKHLIHHLSESIRMNNFKNKVMPDVGELILNRNILGVKFDEDLIIKSRTQTQQFNFVKKNILLSMDVSNANNTMASNLTNPYRSIENLRPGISVLTKIEPRVDEYMRQQLGINIKKIPRHEIPNISRPFSQSGSIPINFINDSTKNKKVYIFGLKLKDMNLPHDVLESFEYFKGVIISNMKKYDQRGIGSINKQNCIDAIIEANINQKMTRELCKNIIHIYNKGAEYVEYMKFITNLLKDCNTILNKTNIIQPYFHLPIEEKKLSKSIVNKEKYNINLVNKDALLSPKNNNIIFSKKTEVDNVKKEMQLIEALIPKLKIKYRNSLDQNISYNELNNILSQYHIILPKEKIIQILNFLDVPNINAFNLSDLIYCFKNVKIINADSLISLKQETSLEDDILAIYSKIKDIIFVKGGFNFLFQHNKTQLTKNDFVSLLKSPVSPYETETLSTLYDYLVKTNRLFTINDYNLYFASNEIKFDSTFESKAMLALVKEIEKKHLKIEQYFDSLLKYNINTNNKVISRNDFVSIMQKEKFKYSALELDYIFTYLDVKKDNVLDKEEFLSRIIHEQLPLTKTQLILKNHNIDIEDLAHRMDIDINSPNQKYTFEMFVDKIKKIDNTLSHEFILSIFNSLKNQESDNFIYSHSLLDAFNVSKKEHLRNITEGKPSNYIPSFRQNYISTLRKTISYQEMKRLFENADHMCSGFLPPNEYTRILKQVIPQFSDDDHTKYARISNLCDINKHLNYSQWLNSIFYDEKSDNFNLIVNTIINELQTRFNGNIDLMIKHISKSSQGITLDKMKQFLTNELKIENVQMKTLTKLDVDANGIISSQDLNSVLKRYQKTAFFKYDNKNELPNINLYPAEVLSPSKVKVLVKKLKQYMKMNNINEICLFKMIDKNGDGFISNPDFNETIDTILPLAPSIKDQLFNYLDYYHNGLIDLETFVYRFKDFDSFNTLPSNKNEIEKKILSAFSEFILNNKTLSDIEIFNLIDKDNDGIINIEDLKYFAEHTLGIDKKELLNIKLDRVLETLSLTKNKHVGLNDIKIYMDEIKVKENKDIKYTSINECDILKTTTNQNLYSNKVNVDWINSVIERFGLFVSEEYNSIEEFIYNNTENHSGKFTFNDFLRFHDNNYKCFKDGFNLTKDELLAVFTSLDSQKKKYLTQNDLENKLQIFDFYKKMHNDIKRFLSDNFNSGVDAFKIFINPKGFDDNELLLNSSSSKNSITHKEFFDAINYLFPKKYSTNTILKYIEKYFKGNSEEIKFVQFNYLYYDSIKSNHHFLKNKLNDMKLINKKYFLSRSQSNFFSPQHKLIQTPFDNDPLLKIKRIILSCKYDLDSIFLTAKALSSDGKYLNKFQFRNLIKQLNLGLTNSEIDYIMKKSGMTFDGFINLNQFITYLRNQDSMLYKSFQNSTNIVAEFKHMIYKYYSNPLLCFQSSIKAGSIKLDFETFKNIITDMYKKDQRQQPNFTQIKTAFDVIDLKKDGLIDLNEWTKSFGLINGNLDVNENNLNIPNGNSFDDNFKLNKVSMSQEVKNRKVLREWESSTDVRDIYKLIWKHKKRIKENLKKIYFIEGSEMLVQSDNLVTVLKEFLPEMKLSNTQWKMLVLICKTDTSNLIDVDLFFVMVEAFAKSTRNRPKMKFK